jgi:hypothetical protein
MDQSHSTAEETVSTDCAWFVGGIVAAGRRGRLITVLVTVGAGCADTAGDADEGERFAGAEVLLSYRPRVKAAPAPSNGKVFHRAPTRRTGIRASIRLRQRRRSDGWSVCTSQSSSQSNRAATRRSDGVSGENRPSQLSDYDRKRRCPRDPVRYSASAESRCALALQG